MQYGSQPGDQLEALRGSHGAVFSAVGLIGFLVATKPGDLQARHCSILPRSHGQPAASE